MIDRIRTKIFADGADLDSIVRLAEDPLIEGFTTNPTLMRKAGLTDYEEFAKRLLERVKRQPISFDPCFSMSGNLWARRERNR